MEMVVELTSNVPYDGTASRHHLPFLPLSIYVSTPHRHEPMKHQFIQGKIELIPTLFLSSYDDVKLWQFLE